MGSLTRPSNDGFSRRRKARVRAVRDNALCENEVKPPGRPASPSSMTSVTMNVSRVVGPSSTVPLRRMPAVERGLDGTTTSPTARAAQQRSTAQEIAKESRNADLVSPRTNRACSRGADVPPGASASAPARSRNIAVWAKTQRPNSKRMTVRSKPLSPCVAFTRGRARSRSKRGHSDDEKLVAPGRA